MRRSVILMVTLSTMTMAVPLEAQSRRNTTRQEVARAQGVPPGQLPPPELCRVWYSDRPAGRQPSATSCQSAQRIASRDRNARVIYGESAYRVAYGNDPYGYNDPYANRYPDNDRGVSRPGRNRDQRRGGGTYDTYDDRNDRYSNPTFAQGYRDGLDKGREDANDNDRYDPNRHSWYRSATRGYESRYGSRADYQARYREAFEAGYSEGYSIYQRR